MKKLLSSAITLGLLSHSFVLNAASHTLITNYNDLSAALNRGDDVRMVIDFDKCTQTGDHLAKGDARGETMGMKFNMFYQQHLPNENNKMAITTSDSRIIDDKSYNLGRVFAYKMLRVYEDNSAIFYTGFYKPKSLKLIAGGTNHCQLGKGMMIYDLG